MRLRRLQRLLLGWLKLGFLGCRGRRRRQGEDRNSLPLCFHNVTCARPRMEVWQVTAGGAADAGSRRRCCHLRLLNPDRTRVVPIRPGRAGDALCGRGLHGAGGASRVAEGARREARAWLPGRLRNVQKVRRAHWPDANRPAQSTERPLAPAGSPRPTTSRPTARSSLPSSAPSAPRFSSSIRRLSLTSKTFSLRRSR